MSVLTLYVDEVMRKLSNDGQYPFVVKDKTVDIVRFALNTGFTDVVLDENTALRVMYQRPGESQVRAQTLTYYDTDGLHNFYDWNLLPSDLSEKGILTVALCILRTDGDVEEWHTTPCQIRVLDTIHTDDSDEADETITPTVAQRVAILESMIQRVASGAPIVVASTSAMTDTSQIYVLSTDGMWYYHNGSAWVAGGEYGAVATDTTLTQANVPADAKVVGVKIAEVNVRLDENVSDLKSALNESNTFHRGQVVYGENRYYHDGSRLIKDKYIAPSDGSFEPYDGWSISDFIPVDPDTVYVMAYYSGGRYIVSNNNYYALYDANFKYIRSATIQERQTNTITTTAETAYVRNSTVAVRFLTSTIFVEKSVFDLGVEHFIPFSVKFINDNTAEEVSELQSDFSELQSDFSEKKDVALTVENEKRYSVFNGQLQIATGINYSAIKSAIISVTAGDRYYYTGRVYNYTNQYSLIAVDSNDVPIEYDLAYTSDTQVVDYLFAIPTNATKLIVQSYASNPTVQKLEVANFQEILNSKIDISDSVPQYDNVMRSIQRIGGFGGAPHHSVTGYVNAYKAGFRILLCDLRFTSDNVPVLFHDEYLNKNYSDVYDSNGQLVGTDPPINIADNTYETLNEYDYGLYKGEVYQGYPLMTLYDMLSLAKRLGVELYIEVKDMTEAQAKIACDAVCAYGMSEKTSWSGAKSHMRYVIGNIDTARVSVMPSSITSSIISDLISLKTGKNKVFVFAWDTTTLTSEIVSQLIENDIAFEFGTLNTEADILSYFERGAAYYYCTGIESDYYIAGKTILENALS